MIRRALILASCLVLGFGPEIGLTPVLAQSDRTSEHPTAVKGAWSAIQDPNLEVRRRAVEYLVDVSALTTIPDRYSGSLRDTILELCQSDDISNQWVAAKALGFQSLRAGDDDSIDWLKRLAETGLEEPAVQSLVARAVNSTAARQVLVELLASDSGDARVQAAAAIYRTGRQRQEALDVLKRLVEDGRGHWEAQAAEMLVQLPLNAREITEVLPGMVTAMKHRRLSDMQRVTVASAVLRLAPNSVEAAGILVDLSNNEQLSPLIRGDAAAALVQRSPRYRDQAIHTISQMTRRNDFFIGNLHELTVDSEGLLSTTLELSRDRDPGISLNAIDALTTNASLTDVPDTLVERLLEIVANPDFEDYIRADAARSIGDLARRLVDPSIASTPLYRLLEEHADQLSGPDSVSVEIAAALMQLEPDAEHQNDLLRILANAAGGDSINNQLAAAKCFEQLNESSRRAIIEHLIADIVTFDRFENQSRRTLQSIGPLPLASVMAILDGQYEQRELRYELRYLAYIAGGGNDDTVNLIRWTGSREVWPESSSTDECRTFLALIESAWNLSGSWPQLQDDLAGRITEVIGTGNWQIGHDETLLDQWQARLGEAGFTDRRLVVANRLAELQPSASSIDWKKWLIAIAGTLTLHACFWILLLSVYPRSRHVQAIFFWNSWVRRIAGFAYVGWLLAWVPPLRRVLFSPFRANLLSDAAIDELDDTRYFADLNVWNPKQDQVVPLAEALTGLRGRILLEGESGLGKSLVARRLARDTRRIVVFLSAEKCSSGVVPAIQDLLHGPAMDKAYLSTLVYSGSLDVIIDGLNEVDPDTRARIVNFVEKNSSCNVLLTSQPIDAEPPAGVDRLVMQPLDTSAVGEFLQAQMPAGISGHEALKFKQRATDFLVHSLSPELPNDALQANRRILSNPMDLTLVASLLSDGQKPDLFRLQQQQFQVMASWFTRTHVGVHFPDAFSETVYEMRLNGISSIPEPDFAAELQCMQRFKMVIVRHARDARGNMAPRWYFRHDKIMDFFIVKTFLGQTERMDRHLTDSRFRGVYFLLATMLPLDQAMRLRERLIQHASRSNDTSLLRPFLELLEYRRAA